MEIMELGVGVDVGSTTVKAVVLDKEGNILWKKYQRHNAKQAEITRTFLKEILDEYPNAKIKTFITGSGGRGFAKYINAKYIQEVNAVTYAVEKLHPDTGSVIELGGQDAKVIIWKEDEEGNKSTVSFMNDKCAGGTGATIDKIFTKIGITHEFARNVDIEGKTTHHIAAKCGVFAETDVVGLLKSGVDQSEIVVSFSTAIVKQNIEVLIRGNILRDKVLLLGGPNTFLPMMQELWRKHIPETWEIHSWKPEDIPLSKLIYVPENAEYFAALGAVLFGNESELLYARSHDGQFEKHGILKNLDVFDKYLEEGRKAHLESYGASREGLVKNEKELKDFEKKYAIKDFTPPSFRNGEKLQVYLGIDGGSTSSKIALIDCEGELVYKDYMLSEGNPIADTINLFKRMKEWKTREGIDLEILKTSVTGYASSILHEAFLLDTRVVETVAHMKSSLFYYGDVDVICDIGGQDIKILFMKNQRVVDFKLNTQCSAGNGYFLQAMAEQFNVPIEKYAEYAFKAETAPAFNYGCAVFMEQDKVNFQRLGWNKEEIMAGLALVLPLNVWNYVVQESNIAKFGHRFVLQGGTQKNLAAVKAQVDYINEKVDNAEIHVHKYADICGAIGAAIEAKDMLKGESRFIGIDAASEVTYTTTNNESTRCTFCVNKCPRIFVDVNITSDKSVRFISGNACEKGASDNLQHMKENERKNKEILQMYPNLVEESSVIVFDDYKTNKMPSDINRSSEEARKFRASIKMGIPKLLNLYVYAPFFNAYFHALGIKDVIYSDYTSQNLWEEGNKWGSIDPCFPAKVAPAHIYNLMQHKDVTHICFPMVTHLQSHLQQTLGENACVIQMGTPEVVEAAFTREKDHFEERHIEYYKPLVRLDRPMETEASLFEYFEDRLKITKEENAFAVEEGYKAQEKYYDIMRSKGKDIINDLVKNDKIGIVVLGHPYHHDPGLNHNLLRDFQFDGFSILCIESLPVDGDFLNPLFPEYHGVLPNDISDVWERNFNRNTNLKVWAARVISRHPNLSAIDLSSFKCGHDAPTYSYIDNIMDSSATPHFLFHDIDQSKPAASMKIRKETIEYFLCLESEKLKKMLKEGAK